MSAFEHITGTIIILKSKNKVAQSLTPQFRAFRSLTLAGVMHSQRHTAIALDMRDMTHRSADNNGMYHNKTTVFFHWNRDKFVQP